MRQTGEILAGFLPRLNKQQAGVLAEYHFDRPDKGDDLTIIIWEDEDAVKAYRKSALVQETMAFDKAHNMPGSREGYALNVGKSDQL